MTRLSEFYASLGDLFGATEGRPSPHRGLDSPHEQGTPIPSWCEGEVVALYHDPALGYVVVIETVVDGATAYAGFCHLLQRPDLAYEQQIEVGEIIGAVGNTGSSSRGNHLHATLSFESSRPERGSVVDPLPHIKLAIANEEEEKPMQILYQSTVPNAGVVYERDTVTNTTRILGKTDGSLGYLGAAPIQNGAKVYRINEAQVRELVSFFPCEPVAKPLYDRLSGNVPAIIGLALKK